MTLRINKFALWALFATVAAVPEMAAISRSKYSIDTVAMMNDSGMVPFDLNITAMADGAEDAFDLGHEYLHLGLQTLPDSSSLPDMATVTAMLPDVSLPELEMPTVNLNDCLPGPRG